MTARTSPSRAHPRSRGENSPPVQARPWVTGSSPLTRGKPAGGGGAQQARGSSPLTRGKRLCDLLEALGIGLIPAHAGKTGHDAFRASRVRAHPHSRGENPSLTCLPTVTVGSSPLTRGKRSAMRRGRSGRGLIPAHAGKTESVRSRDRLSGAHPRSRGENSGSHQPIWRLTGSSPLTRGKQEAVNEWFTMLGLIPAHAGKTTASSISPVGGGAHPRSRGENR